LINTRITRLAGLTVGTAMLVAGMSGIASAAPLATPGNERCATDGRASSAGFGSTGLTDPHTVDAAEAARVMAAVEARQAELGLTDAEVSAAPAASFKVPVYWHVLRAGSSVEQGNLTKSTISKTIKSMNTYFGGEESGQAAKLPFTFKLKKITRTTNADWYDLSYGGADETAAKTSLHRGGASTLNIYTARLSGGLGGWATFPWWYEDDPEMDGIVLLDQMVVGGGLPGYPDGDVFSHEAGHWVGLWHTFQGGCSAPGDEVSDTPPESSPASGCPASRDTCSGGGEDPIHNYMDYVNNECMNQFTPGQKTRATQMWNLYRS
jgi:hypothetical protein